MGNIRHDICKHCNCLINSGSRNPSGFCDHLYYPENCDVCSLDKFEDETIFSSEETPYEQFARLGYKEGFKQGKKQIIEKIEKLISEEKNKIYAEENCLNSDNKYYGKVFRQD